MLTSISFYSVFSLHLNLNAVFVPAKLDIVYSNHVQLVYIKKQPRKSSVKIGGIEIFDDLGGRMKEIVKRKFAGPSPEKKKLFKKLSVLPMPPRSSPSLLADQERELLKKFYVTDFDEDFVV